MTSVSDAALRRLREAADWPDLCGTRYRVEGVLSRGGMGVVYRATDLELEREVALKVLSSPEPTPDACERMRREARILARLEHPGIVPVHDVGTLPDGRTFYVMKRVRGAPLHEWCVPARSLAERLRVMERACEAVAFAHAHGILHRDLKPENVMVGEFGEVLVMDWGVAKLVGEAAAASDASPTGETEGTAAGTVIGTPGWMSPEQARGDLDAIDVRADVYGLGAVLCFLLSGRPPAPARTLGEMRAWADAGGRQDWMAAARGAPARLVAIASRALALEPARRYAVVRELAADLERFRAGQAVEAHREGPLERVARFVSTHRVAVGLVLAYLVMRAALWAWAGR
jgi:serine/threonine protein kinase